MNRAIFSFIVLVILTAVAAGLPAFWLIRRQLEHQAWAQVGQGSRAAQALYAAWQSEMTSLATLTAQRPTLRTLLVHRDPSLLLPYLRPLQTGAKLDLILIRGPENGLVAQVGESIPDTPCPASTFSGFCVLSDSEESQIWLLASQAISSQRDDWHGTVVVGTRLDEEFVREMRNQTGLDHTLLVDRRPVVTTLTAGLPSRRPAPSDFMRGTFNVDGAPYYAAWFPLTTRVEGVGGGTTLEAEVSLAVTDIAAAERGLAWTLAGSISGSGGPGAGESAA